MVEDKRINVAIIGTGAANARLLASMAGKDAGTCDINDPIEKKPDVEGSYGKAWKVDLDATRRNLPNKGETDCTLVHWIIECPLANPVWHSYSLILIHLRPIEGGHETIFHLEGATHELWLHVLDPNGDRRKVLGQGQICKETCTWLSPTNYSSQIIEVTDELALRRIQDAVQMICDGKLSPDTDHLQSWMALFGNNMIKKEYR